MKYILYLVVCSLPLKKIVAQCAVDSENDIPSIKIRKKPIKMPFDQALQLPQTATSCDCPSNSPSTLTKLGCQHPDLAAICKVVIIKFDVAIIPKQGDAIVIKEIEGSFLNNLALSAINAQEAGEFFVSYSNIIGMTEEGKEVVVPSFGTEKPHQRASRNYISINDYISITDTKVDAFELVAYNANNQMVFRQNYQKDSFDKNAMRPDAVRYVFKNIKGKHLSGVEMEILNFETSNFDARNNVLYASQ